MILKLKDGDIKIELFEDVAPNHVKRIKQLAKDGKYDGVVFHRVIDGFMAQTGDVQFGNSSNDQFDLKRAGMGGSDLPDLKEEFSDLPHERGTLSMARSQDPNSANSQFFICFKEASFLDRQYTVFGKVIEGMDLVDKIKRGDQNNILFWSPLLILSTKSIPSITLPKTVYCLSRNDASLKQIKNWLLALFGSCDLAIDKVPLSWGKSLNSSLRSGKSEPPIPALFKSNWSLEELPNCTSPVWAIKPSITLWNTTPSYFPSLANCLILLTWLGATSSKSSILISPSLSFKIIIFSSAIILLVSIKNKIKNFVINLFIFLF